MKILLAISLIITSLLFAKDDDLKIGEKVPNKPEKQVVGKVTTKIKRGTKEFKKLIKNTNLDIVFKDEEEGEADHYMTKRLNEKVNKLAKLVKNEWKGLKLRVAEAWDEQDEHSKNSTHYEARGVDITVSDRDTKKLGRLARLAVDAGFDWVLYEDKFHVHASVKKDK